MGTQLAVQLRCPQAAADPGSALLAAPGSLSPPAFSISQRSSFSHPSASSPGLDPSPGTGSWPSGSPGFASRDAQPRAAAGLGGEGEGGDQCPPKSALDLLKVL